MRSHPGASPMNGLCPQYAVDAARLCVLAAGDG